LTLFANSTSIVLTVTPVDDSAFEPSETVTVTLGTGTGYSLGTPTAATGTITDNDSSVVAITATDASGSENLPDPIVFSVTRTGGLANTTTVAVTWSGTATRGTDYVASVTGVGGTVTFGTNQATLIFSPGATGATITMNPVDDTTVESTETVGLAL